jgi:hypothetical protein
MSVRLCRKGALRTNVLSLLMDSSHSPISLEIKRLHPKCEGVVLIEQCPSEKQWGLVCMMR